MKNSMRAKMAPVLFLALCAFFFFGCNFGENDPSCDQGEPVPFEILEADGAVCKLENVNETSLVIDNQSDFEQYIRCNQSVSDIDFENSFVLAGVTSLPACGRLKNQDVIFKCNRLEYHIEIEDMACHKPTNVFYFATIPIAYRNYPVEFTIAED